MCVGDNYLNDLWCPGGGMCVGDNYLNDLW